MLDMFNLLLLQNATPTLSGLDSLVRTEVGYALIIILVLAGTVFFAKGKFGKMLTFIVMAAILFSVITFPEQILGSLSAIAELIF